MNFMAMIGREACLGTALRMLRCGEHESARVEVLDSNGAYDAYAPEPMVLDMRRKGSSLGRGTACDC
jgi:hypothetical protein